MRRLMVLVSVFLLAAPASWAADVRELSDEFDDPASIARWTRVQVAEQWGNEPLEVWDVDVTRPGHMTMVPFTVTWFQDYLGPFAYQMVGGDFAVTTDVTSTGRDGVSVPNASFSLAGIMVRRPRGVTPATWTPGGENYVFLSIGYGNGAPREFQFEVKTTTSGTSILELTPAGGSRAKVQVARIGDAVLCLRQRLGQPWAVHRRYHRADFPETLQVGLVAYTDWNKVQYFPPFTHNTTTLDPPLGPGVDPRPDVPFAPDLDARFDYARYVRPEVPPELAGLDLANPAQVSDAQLLSFLGAAADVAAPVSVPGAAAPRPRGLVAGPNPFAEHLELRYALAEAGPVRIDVYGTDGRRVRAVERGHRDAGEHLASWDGRDDAGRRVVAGVYWVRVETASGSSETRVARLR